MTQCKLPHYKSRMDEFTRESALAVADYLHPEARKKWIEAGEPKDKHIYLDVERLIDWLEAN